MRNTIRTKVRMLTSAFAIVAACSGDDIYTSAPQPTIVLHSEFRELAPRTLDCHGGVPEGAKSEVYDTMFEGFPKDVTHPACECQWTIGDLGSDWLRARKSRLGVSIGGAILTFGGGVATAVLAGRKNTENATIGTGATTAGAGLVTALGALVPKEAEAYGAYRGAYSQWTIGVNAMLDAASCQAALKAGGTRIEQLPAPMKLEEIEAEPEKGEQQIRELRSKLVEETEKSECSVKSVRSKLKESREAFLTCAAMSAGPKGDERG